LALSITHHEELTALEYGTETIDAFWLYDIPPPGEGHQLLLVKLSAIDRAYALAKIAVDGSFKFWSGIDTHGLVTAQL
jgi:hypothetical protein